MKKMHFFSTGNSAIKISDQFCKQIISLKWHNLFDYISIMYQILLIQAYKSYISNSMCDTYTNSIIHALISEHNLKFMLIEIG